MRSLGRRLARAVATADREEVVVVLLLEAIPRDVDVSEGWMYVLDKMEEEADEEARSGGAPFGDASKRRKVVQG